MSRLRHGVATTLTRLKKDKRGMEVIQSVLMVALAAIMLLGVNKFFNGTVKDGVKARADEVMGQGKGTAKASSNWQ